MGWIYEVKIVKEQGLKYWRFTYGFSDMGYRYTQSRIGLSDLFISLDSLSKNL